MVISKVLFVLLNFQPSRIIYDGNEDPDKNYIQKQTNGTNLRNLLQVFLCKDIEVLSFINFPYFVHKVKRVWLDFGLFTFLISIDVSSLYVPLRSPIYRHGASIFVQPRASNWYFKEMKVREKLLLELLALTYIRNLRRAVVVRLQTL